MHFTLSKRFRNEYIFAATLYQIEKTELTKEKFQSTLRSYEFLEAYEQNILKFSSYSLLELAEKFCIEFHIDTQGEYKKIGFGRPIFIRKIKTVRIFTEPLEFFYIPNGLKNDGKCLTRFDEMLTFAENSKSSTLCKRVKISTSKIEPCPLLTENFFTLEKVYNCCINIYSKQKCDKTNKYNYKSYRFALERENSPIINLHFMEKCKKYVLITDETEYFSNFYKCKNDGCRFVFSKKREYESHFLVCNKSTDLKMKIKQVEIKNIDLLLSKARNHGLMTSDPRNENFIFYDIESALPKSNLATNKTTILSTHQLISIAVNAYINGVHEQKVWTVKDSTEKSQILMVGEFLDFCLTMKSKMKLDKALENDIEKLQKLRGKFRIENFDMNEISEILNFLSPFKELSVFGYNNARYDNKIIFPYLIQSLDDRDYVAKDISILKKGTSYFSIKFDGLSFKDLMHFTAPTSLDNYMQTWLTDTHKLAYPYELFSSIEDVRNCIEFPSKESFYSAIKGSVDPEVYDECRKIYETHRSLPATHENYWSNFEDYLKSYNLSDVTPASLALIKQFQTYQENFGVCPMQFMGLPSFSRHAMLKLYDKNAPSIFTFFDKETTYDFRSQIIGGLTNVYHRHVTTQEESNAAYHAIFNKNGEKWAKISFFDVNSMYPSTFRNKFPCGLGFKWIKSGKKLRKSIMTNKKVSLQAIQWLDFVQRNDCNLISKNGDRVKLQFGWGSSEHKIGHYYVDGFAIVDGMQIIYEFDGCYYHECDICKQPHIAKYDPLRIRYFEKLENSKVIRMTGCQWSEICKNQNLGESKISKILFKANIEESEMIEMIHNNELYGFVLCDIISTQKSRKFLEVNWPPLIFKDNINLTDLPVWMQANTCEKDFPRNTFVQGMFRNNLLLHTDLAYFYAKNGFLLTKIHKFYEFEGFKCLKPVFDAVYEARVQATQHSDKREGDMKATAVKLVSNSMYGQMLMVS